MNEKSYSREKFRALHAQAEQLLKNKESSETDTENYDLAQLIHELEVQQMELELQNQELRRARSELEAARDEYTDLFESSPVGYVTLDRNGLIEKANTSAYALLGFENELIGYRFSDHIEKDDLPSFKAYLNALASDQKPSPIEVRIPGPEGEFHARLEATTEYDEDGNLRRWRLSLVDITERKQSEDALRESEERFRSIFQHHTAVKLLIDPDTGNIVETNEAAERFYGWPVEKLKTMQIQEINLLLEDEVRERMAKAKSRERTYFEFQHRLADGSVKDVEVYSSTIEVKGKEFLHSIVHDITKRKEAEENIREQSYLLDMITTTSPVAITVLNAEGRITFANPAAEATLDLAKGDITARTYNDTEWRICGHHGEHFPEEELPFNVVRRTGRPIHDVEHAIEHPNGRRILLSINAAPLKDASGEFVGVVSVLTDITERKQAETALLERNKELHCLQRVRNSLDESLSEEALFRRILEAIKEGVQYPNEAVPVIILGDERYSLDAQRDNLKIGLHADIRVEGEPVGSLSVYYRSDKPFLLPEEQNLVEATSKVLGHHLERTHAQEKLRDREERLKLALHGADLGTWDWNVQTGQVTFNERWAAMLGYSSGEIQPFISSWETLIHSDDKPDVMKELSDHLEGKTETYETEHRVKHRSGEWIWILDKGKVIERDALGAPVRVCGTHLDITERKRAEREDQLNNARLEIIHRMATMPEATEKDICDFALEGMLALTDSAIGFIGFMTDDEEVIQIHAWSSSAMTECAIHDRPLEFPVADAGLWGEPIRNREPVIVNDYGQPHPAKRGRPVGHVDISRFMAIPVFEGGRVVAIAAVGNKDMPYEEAEARQLMLLMDGWWEQVRRKHEIREKEALQARLQQAQKMEAIGTLAGGIAHDFNNILSIILGNAEMVMYDLQESSFARESLNEVRKASLRARDLVTQILLFARQQEEKVSNIRLEPIAKECLKMLRASIPTTVEIQQEIEKDLPPVHADPSQIQQVIMNLCTNAGQVMEAKGGTLEVILDSIELEAPLDTMTGRIPEGRYIRLLVRDTGPGIEPENMERIFDPFFTTKGVGEGTGLGLAVVHGIVAERNGGISLESEIGRGTAFRVYLPALEKERAEKLPEEKPALPKGSERILFVDDEPMILRLGQRMLERQGYEVETRASGIDALECFKHDPERFDLVLTDMSMPGMRGDKLAEEMMSIREDVPVILSTGYSKQISKERAEELGIRAFVMKPLTQQELANTVRRVLDES